MNSPLPVPLSDRLVFLVEHLDLAAATGDPEAQWEAFQLAFLNSTALMGIEAKARQVGWSWIAAADAVADAALTPRLPNIFVSVNQEEAAEKVRYARLIIDALDADARPRLIIDNKLELELENGSRLISHPSRPPRGKARANLYLDEFAHYAQDREIYQAAVPVLTKGGRLRIGSSPLGAQGLFWEIYAQKLRPYPGYTRTFTPWWCVRALCRDVAAARQLAGHMLTDERVRRFGTARLVQIYENLPLEDFQQEYECAWVDEALAWITWDEIKRNQVEAQAGRLWYRQARTVDQALTLIAEVALAVREGQIETAFAGGMDVGRKHNLSEIVLVGKATTGQLPYRLGISLAGVEFDDQAQVAGAVLDKLPVTQLLVDRSGLGMQLAENLEKKHGQARVQGVDFTNESKELWSVEIKVQLQRAHVPLPLERELGYQLHSIKKKITAAKNAVFDTEANEKHHADKYWALALAVWAARTQARPPGGFEL